MKFSVVTSAYNQLSLLQKAHAAWQAQTCSDFEWVIADDGSSDGTGKWCREQGIKHVWQEDTGYNLVPILNKATPLCEGEYIAYVMADSYPKEDFLEQFVDVVHDSGIFNGVRMNVDASGHIVSPDWRLSRTFQDLTEDCVKMYHPRVWELMTLNSMVLSHDMLVRLGGWDEGYKGYGRMDWDLPAKAYYSGAAMYWVPKAIIYHRDHPDRDDTPANIEYFNFKLGQYREGSKFL